MNDVNAKDWICIICETKITLTWDASDSREEKIYGQMWKVGLFLLTLDTEVSMIP